MGTRGYGVYRYKRRFIVLYNHGHSDPPGLGLDILREIPSSPEEFQQWLKPDGDPAMV
jgi:hypothetical protein